MKKRIFQSGCVALVSMLAVFILAACLPSGLSEGYNDDPRSFEEYPEYSASIYVHNGLALPYRLYKPEKEEGKSFPLLVFLHGSGENGVDNQNQIYEEFAKYMPQYMETLGQFYIMIPQAKKKKNWDFYLKEDADNVLSAAIDDLILRNADVDTSRLYLAGMSLGGFGTISELRLEPEKFAAAFSICGGISDYWYESEDYRPNETIFRELSNTPLLLAHGTDDTVVPYAYSEEIYKEIDKVGGEVRFETLTGYAHNIWNKCFETAEYWEWLFSHTRAA